VIVQYVGNFDTICRLGRELSASAPDRTFSANDIVELLGQSANELCDALCDREHQDWICRADSDWKKPATSDTRWCVREHRHLTPDSHYEVLGYEVNLYRILNDTNEPVLFHESLFRIVDANIPDFWHLDRGEDREFYRGPKMWLVPSYWERFHDKETEIVEDFWRTLSSLHPKSWIAVKRSTEKGIVPANRPEQT